MKYTFYFDESFHDRVIKLNKSGVLNTMVPNALDSYIGVFWGCKKEKAEEIESLLYVFEEKYIKKFGLENNKELKSQTIAKKNYIHGIRSFSKNAYDFYWDLFSLIKTIQPILQIEIISKTEYVVRKIVDNMVFDPHLHVNKSTFIYSFTKFINTYHTNELLECLFNICDEKSGYNFRKTILNHLKCILSEIKEIKRKKREYLAFQQLYIIFKKSRIVYFSNNDYTFSYVPNFNGLSLLLDELGIPIFDVSVFIDNEEKTFNTAQKYEFDLVEQVDSSKSIQIRLSDWISGFIGRIIYAIKNDKRMLEDKISHLVDISQNDLSTKRILSKEWFDIREKDYNLYMLIFDSLIVGHEHYWTTMTTTNCDQAILFYALLRYFASYKSYKKYSEVEPAMHSEYYNSRLIGELNEYYKRIEQY